VVGGIIVTNIIDEINDDFLLDIIRSQRNNFLLASDWTQLADSSVDKEAWAAYRQQLRDLPASNTNPRLIVFPTLPA
jgi:hypothetical protein